MNLLPYWLLCHLDHAMTNLSAYEDLTSGQWGIQSGREGACPTL